MNPKVDKEDVELKPNHNADTTEEVSKNISFEILEMYDVYSYRHAAAILKNSFPNELKEIEQALSKFRITLKDMSVTFLGGK